MKTLQECAFSSILMEPETSPISLPDQKSLADSFIPGLQPAVVRLTSIVCALSSKLKTPSVNWTDDNRPYLVPPAVEHLPTRRGQGIHASGGLSWENGIPWGDVPSWRPSRRKFGSAWVNCVAIEFALPKGSFGYLE